MHGGGWFASGRWACQWSVMPQTQHGLHVQSNCSCTPQKPHLPVGAGMRWENPSGRRQTNHGGDAQACFRWKLTEKAAQSLADQGHLQGAAQVPSFGQSPPHPGGLGRQQPGQQRQPRLLLQLHQPPSAAPAPRRTVMQPWQQPGPGKNESAPSDSFASTTVDGGGGGRNTSTIAPPAALQHFLVRSDASQLPEQRRGSLLRTGASIRIGIGTGKSQNRNQNQIRHRIRLGGTQIMLQCEGQAMPGLWGPEGTIDLGVRICLKNCFILMLGVRASAWSRPWAAAAPPFKRTWKG